MYFFSHLHSLKIVFHLQISILICFDSHLTFSQHDQVLTGVHRHQPQWSHAGNSTGTGWYTTGTGWYTTGTGWYSRCGWWQGGLGRDCTRHGRTVWWDGRGPLGPQVSLWVCHLWCNSFYEQEHPKIFNKCFKSKKTMSLKPNIFAICIPSTRLNIEKRRGLVKRMWHV